jgi:hypothetical protein
VVAACDVIDYPHKSFDNCYNIQMGNYELTYELIICSRSKVAAVSILVNRNWNYFACVSLFARKTIPPPPPPKEIQALFL